MGGQLVFDWDRLEEFLINRDRPVSNTVTNIKCQSWVSHVQIQSTITLVSDAQTEGKVSVTPKSWLPRNNTKTYYNTCGICPDSLRSGITRGTKEYTWPTKSLITFMYFLAYWLKNVLVRCLVHSVQNQRRSTKWHSAINLSMRSTCLPPWSISVFKLRFLWLEFWTFFLKFYTVNFF